MCHHYRKEKLTLGFLCSCVTSSRTSSPQASHSPGAGGGGGGGGMHLDFWGRGGGVHERALDGIHLNLRLVVKIIFMCILIY